MQEREKKLVKNTIIVAIGKICTQFISFFLLPLYTALLSTEEYGIVDLLNTYISLLVPIFFFQMEQAIFRFLIDVRGNENSKKKILSTAVITIVIQIILFLILFAIVGIFIKNEYKYFLVVNVIASMMSGLVLQISRGLGDNTTYSLGSFISGAGNIIFNVIFIAVFKWGAYGMLLATFLSNMICTIFIFFRKKLYKYIHIKKYDRGTLKELWKFSLPLIPNQLSWWIVNVSDRSIITYILGVGANGIYSAANKFSSICITIFNIFNLTWAESASMHINDEDKSEFFSNIINKTIKLFTSLCIVIIACMPFVFKLLITGEGYADAYYQIPILMISTIFSIAVSLLGSIYVALKKSNKIAKTSILAAIINILVNLLLIKFIGIYAASISTLVSYFAMTIYRYLDVQKYVKIRIQKDFIVNSIIVAILVIFMYYINNKVLCLLGGVIAIAFALKYNYKFISEIISSAKNKIKKKDYV